MIAYSLWTAEILTWAIPLAILLIIGIYWGIYVHRRSDEP